VNQYNAADILTALGEFMTLSVQFNSSPPTNRVCFCLDYNLHEMPSEFV